ncbi:cellulose biosynthesis protein BcsD [Pseudacidovorax sp.]|uniref:cellulose biosynthesis protein BcsD n=1 Tax=Pseudacidovorax sp. TaxID=1934311 RepID=UPI0025EC0992|nr:cellulose biosynthesis protein BcsD [Pseudacidovorax sp.]
MSSLSSEEIAYYESVHCDRQWRLFNQALGVELGEGLPDSELKALFARLGRRVAQSMPLERCQTVAELEAAMNRTWADMHWGFVRLHEDEDRLWLQHHCQPLVASFGSVSLPWAQSFFEGVYEGWLEAQGSPAALAVSALVPDAAEPTVSPRIHLQLHRRADR